MNSPQLMVRQTPLELMRDVAVAGIDYRDRKGFVRCTWDAFTTRMTSLQVELGELATAVDAYQNDRGGLLDVHREFADVALYTVTMLQDIAQDSWTIRARYHGGPRGLVSGTGTVQPMRRHWDDAIRAWQRDTQKDAVISLELLLSATANAITPFGVWSTNAWEALHRAALSKLDSMAGRPQTHGKDPRA